MYGYVFCTHASPRSCRHGVKQKSPTERQLNHAYGTAIAVRYLSWDINALAASDRLGWLRQQTEVHIQLASLRNEHQHWTGGQTMNEHLRTCPPSIPPRLCLQQSATMRTKANACPPGKPYLPQKITLSLHLTKHAQTSHRFDPRPQPMDPRCKARTPWKRSSSQFHVREYHRRLQHPAGNGRSLFSFNNHRLSLAHARPTA